MKNLMNFDGSELLAARLSDWDPFSGSIKVKKKMMTIFRCSFSFPSSEMKNLEKNRENH